MTIEEMKKRKEELGYTDEQIAIRSGVSLSIVESLFAGESGLPKYAVLLALEAVLKPGAEQVREPEFHYAADGEGKSFWPRKQGEYTLEDYYALTGNRRAELIDGVLYFLTAPSPKHQVIQNAIWRTIDDYIHKNEGKCFSTTAPCDVQLREEKDEIYEPDIFVVCDRGKIHKKCVIGAPDLVIEILSPSTKRKDMILKLAKYTEAGVREYWIVDPEEKKILVYPPGEEFEVRIYGFEDQVPVSIFDGKCVIDFAEIHKEAAFLYELEEG